MAHLPAPGASRLAILAAELGLERRLLAAIMVARVGVARAGEAEVDALLAAALAPRRGYAAWPERQLRACGNDPDRVASPPFGEATASLNALFAWLIVAVEQGLAHAFVLRHDGEDRLADAAWTGSGSAMLQGASMIQLFARHFSALQPAAIAAPAELPWPRVGGDVATITQLEGEFACQCHEIATKTSRRCPGTAAEPLCRHIAVSCGERLNWPLDQDRAGHGISPALRSFSAVHRKYVSGGGRT